MRHSDSPLGVGMIGVGNFGAWRRGRMRDAGLFKIIACSDRDRARLNQASAEEGAIACENVEALLATPGVEAVVISTGASSHADLADRAMRAGKDVFVEKPLCCSPEEVERLREVQRLTGSVVGVGHHQNATDPVVQLAKKYIDEGLLGRVAAYEENTSHSGGLQIRPGDWRGQADRNPGGMLFQCGVHAIHKLHAIFGPIEEVQASFRYDVHSQTETADVACVTLRHESGLLGTLNAYHVTAYCHELRLFGTGGNLYIDTFALRAWYQKALYGPIEPRVEVRVERDGGSEVANLQSWYRAVRQRRLADPSLEDGIAAVLPIFAAEKAAIERRTVRLNELFDESARASSKLNA